MNRRNLVLIPILMLSVFALISITAPVSAQEATGTLAEIEDRGYLIVGSDTTYPPFEEYNATSEQAQGFDIDLAHQVAIALGVEVKVVTSDWDPIIPNLKASQFDVIMSAMTITEAREVEVDFTRWYYKSFQAILVEDGNPLGIMTEVDLNATITIGVQSGTTSDLWVQENLNDSVTLSTFDDILLAIAALKLGAVDVVLGDYAVLAQDELESGETEVVDTYSPEDFGFAVRNGDTDLLAALNDAIDGFLGANENSPNPTNLYSTIFVKWFGEDAYTDAGYTGTVFDVTIEYVWYEGGAAPGFEFLLVFAIGIIPIIRRKR